MKLSKISRAFNHTAWIQINKVSNTPTSLKNPRLYIDIFVKCHKLFRLLKKVLSLNYSSTSKIHLP